MESNDVDISEIIASLPLSSTISNNTLQYAKNLYSDGKSKDPEWQNKKQKTCVQGCLYLALVSQSESFNFSSLFDDISQLHSFMITLKEILKYLSITQNVHSTATKLIKNYAIALMNYKKLEELYDKIALKGSFDHLSLIFQSLWFFFIIIRKELYNNTEDLSECGCLIISNLDLFINNMPDITDKIVHSLSVSPIIFLTGSFRTIPAHVKPFVDKINRFCNELITRSIINESLKNSLSSRNINAFISKLNDLYSLLLKTDELDERYIRNTVSNVNNSDLLLTPIARRTVAVTTTKGKVLNWDIDHSVSMNSRLKEVIQPVPTSFQAETPLTSAMQCNSWINKLLEDYSELSITRLCGESYTEIKTRSDTLKTDFIQFIANKRQNFSASKSEDIQIFYYISLENLLKIERNKGGSLSSILQNDKFHRALFACCTETILYIININCVSFEEILILHNITAFDFWKNINSFIQYDIRMPLQVKKHFKDIEERILTCDGWEINSPVSQAIGRISSENFIGELSHPSFGQFFKRVLAYSANRITELCSKVSLNETLQEEIWSTFKYFLSEKTECLISRHLDHIILCTIYGVCKNNKIPISFKILFDHFRILYQVDLELFTKILINEGERGDLIKFYNEIYIETMKNYITNKIPIATSRISTLNPTSPLKANIPHFQVPQSPYLTPKTKRLWAFGENISQSFQGINSMITARKLNFDIPIKRPRKDENPTEELQKYQNTKDQATKEEPKIEESNE